MIKPLKYLYIITTMFCLLFAVIDPAYALDNNPHAKEVADKLNELYSHTKPCDNNAPAYYCSGVIVHGQVVPAKNGSKIAPAWYLPSYRHIGSFSYLRADITPHKGAPIWINTGYILTPADDVEASKQYQYKVHCAYPFDGGTFGELETSCVFDRNNFNGETLSSSDFHSIDDYITKILDNPREPKWNATMGPAFYGDKNGFDLAMQIHHYVFEEHIDKVSHGICQGKMRCRVHNELIISAWDADKVAPEHVPIMAFFAIINDDQNPMFESSGRTSTSEAEMKQLFKDADDYAKAVHYSRSIPVVTIDMAKLRSGASDIFAPAVKP